MPDKRLLAMESEFGSTLQCSNREGNTLSAVVRLAFDTGDLRVASNGSPQTATDAHISIIGHIAGIELNLLLTQSDCANGLANRFLWVAVKRSKLLPEGGRSDTVDFSDIMERLRKALQFARSAGCIIKDAAATELWRVMDHAPADNDEALFFKSYCAPQEPAQGLPSPFSSTPSKNRGGKAASPETERRHNGLWKGRLKSKPVSPTVHHQRRPFVVLTMIESPTSDCWIMDVRGTVVLVLLV